LFPNIEGRKLFGFGVALSLGVDSACRTSEVDPEGNTEGDNEGDPEGDNEGDPEGNTEGDPEGNTEGDSDVELLASSSSTK
jgi:hypothetical protein